MGCPDENAIARIQAGNAPAQELARFHEHLDHCAECMQLIEILSHSDPATSARDETAPPALPLLALNDKLRPRPQVSATNAGEFAQQIGDVRATTSAAAALTNLGCAFIFLPRGARYLDSCLSTPAGLAGWRMLWFTWAVSLELSFIVGPALVLCGLYGLRMNRTWAGKVLRAFAAIAAATLIMAPMAVCLLAALRHDSRRILAQD